MKRRLNKKVTCKDGFTMSVQANEGAYCTPRIDKAAKYTAVEVGYPSDREDLLMEWAESPQKPTETVYGYVPATQITLVVAKHGGIVSGELPAGIPYLTAT
jgi:hypothetical protein|tara:strand:- start:27 stop:329 length:303 start_codon:yes stop_codon:yes gene_type:complete